MANDSYSRRMAKAWTLADIFNTAIAVGATARMRNAAGEKPVDVTVASEAFALPDAKTHVMLATKSGNVFSCSIDSLEFENPNFKPEAANA
jgi:hypothetical protein